LNDSDLGLLWGLFIYKKMWPCIVRIFSHNLPPIFPPALFPPKSWLMPLKRYYAPPDLVQDQPLRIYYQKFWKIKNPNIWLVGVLKMLNVEHWCSKFWGAENMCQNWVLIWRWIMEQKKPWSPGVKPMSFLGVLERLWLCPGSLFFFLLFFKLS
jgi:hypothetical protein